MAAVVARPRPPAGSAMLTAATLVPFLYPTLALATPRCPALRFSTLKSTSYPASPSSCRATPVKHDCSSSRRCLSTTITSDTTAILNDLPESRLNPAPDDYAASSFTDNAEITIYAGRGGNGCVSFLREAYLPDGPPNGGDGGGGGNVYIQAAHGQTSLHKVARRRFVRAGHGQNGQGSSKGGVRGDDVIITVPVGTIVRELERQDPVADESVRVRAYQQVMKARRRAVHELETRMLQQRKMEKHGGQAKKKNKKGKAEEEDEEDEAAVGLKELREVAGIERHGQLAQQLQQESGEIEEDEPPEDPQRDKWLLYPGMSKTDMKAAEFPPLPRRTRLLQQPPGPIYLDLSRPTPRPILLAAGGIGGLGNSHFISRSHRRPLFATKGEAAPTLRISLELKLLADVGLVGLPNAGKSTLLRALTNSRARVGNWAFTTLVPNIGTVVLDKYEGRQRWALRRPRHSTEETKVETDADGYLNEEEACTRFTVADIPGLIEGAHLDRGLGIAFLRHVERAGVLAFVVDLSAGDAVAALKALWREVALYATMRDEEERVRAATIPDADEAEDPFHSGTVNLMMPPQENVMQASITTPTMHTAGKPWFVVATKADQPDTQLNFAALKRYLESVTSGAEPHPSGVVDGAWVKNCAAIPVSAIHGQGVQRIVHWTVGLLNQE
ncbi:hypothetical protein MY10362_000234 [Beauveria mimosiformis]